MGNFFISRSWRTRNIMIACLVIEFAFTVAVLTLFGIASPNLYRTKLWQEGYDLGFNSAPNAILYAMANYRPVNIPMVWSQFLTTWNLVISVLSMFILLTKTTLFTMHMFYPILSLLTHIACLAIYSVSLHGQIGHDTIDRDHPSTGLPWYIGHSCGMSSTNKIKGYCLQAKASFVMTILMVILFSIYIILAIHSMIPTKEQRLRHVSKVQEKSDRKSKIAALQAETLEAQASLSQYWAAQGHQYPLTPGTMGPRSARFATSPHPYSPAPYSAGGPFVTQGPYSPGIAYAQSPISPVSPYQQWQAAYGPPTSPAAPPATHYTSNGDVDYSKQQWEMHQWPASAGTHGAVKSPVHSTASGGSAVRAPSDDLPLRER
ncbi:uncharacterized protein K452DRAFT_287187 [Aplosporella prunicola CBS 121167]|uniref:MARVEL domain-containing protein n=1 Tax=Aplosporella prunicola CBS 121167 TaxID=1176127 RepID=A0A6A6BFA9_9PEZI|nr:uncharacterized protein K452DRAFT_287187 [Aplosporella prunicola CBS 121167]KAF2141995.1 hypothetical protein K452DRAFT_287187 [Aplosporella prunicola CBS 121167]